MHIKVIHKVRSTVTSKLNRTIKIDNDQYLVCIPRLTLPKDLLNVDSDSKLTMLGSRLFHTLIMRSLKMLSYINTTVVNAQLTTAARPMSVSAYQHRASHHPQMSSAIYFTGIPSAELYSKSQIPLRYPASEPARELVR